MGHVLSCSRDGADLFRAVQHGDLDALLAVDPELARRATTIYDRLSLLHIAAANGQLQVRSLLVPLFFLLCFSSWQRGRCSPCCCSMTVAPAGTWTC
jgi:hypothetical protein